MYQNNSTHNNNGIPTLILNIILLHIIHMILLSVHSPLSNTNLIPFQQISPYTSWFLYHVMRTDFKQMKQSYKTTVHHIGHYNCRQARRGA